MEYHQHRLILSLLAYYAQKDFDAEDLCVLSGMDFKSLKEGKTFVFCQKQMNDLWLNAVKISRDSLFGLHFCESMQLAALGAVGELIKTSNTVGEALTQATTLTHHITNLFSMDVIKEDKVFNLVFLPNNDIKQTEFVFKQNIDFFMAFAIHELDGLLLNKIKPKKITYACDIIDSREYERVLRCVPTTGSSYLIQFDIKYWDEIIITGNYVIQRRLLQYINELTASQSDQLGNMVYNYLIAKSYLGIASVKDIAGNFNVSVRTLQRRLEEEGTSFQYLADQARKELALKYMESGAHQIKEISYMLGYNELSAFTRAFRRWTGTSPTAYEFCEH